MGWGDEIMAAGQARLVRERDPERRRVRILDRHKHPRDHAAWAGNDDIVRPGEAGDFSYVLNGPGARPYIAAKLPGQWVWKDWREGAPPLGVLHFTQEERDFGRLHSGRIFLEPNLKPKASPNKDWGWVRWAKLAWLLQEKHGQRVSQLGPIGTPMLLGAEHVVTNDFRRAAAVLAGATAAVLPEGGLHHAAAAVGLPAVVIFGGFIAPRHTGYAGHVNLFTGGQACGMRVRCEHCRDAMAKISPEEVAAQLMGMVNERVARAVSA